MKVMSIHMIKLAVGAESLADFADYAYSHAVDYHGEKVNPVWTRHKPKRADELVRKGYIYRVIKNRIVCKQKILGFEPFEHPVKGKMNMIMTGFPIIKTAAQMHRPFQGWRYFEPAKTPKDIGPYNPDDEGEAPPADLAEALSAAGLL